jgi:cell division transport system ATP-binding protein
VIEFESASKVYTGGRQALTNVNFRLAPGEMAFLTGHSGAGKSTLLRLLLGLEKASTGAVRVAGTNLAELSGEKLAKYRRRVGVVFQDPNLEDDLTVFDNVALPLRIAGFNEIDIPKRVNAALSRVDLSDQAQASPRVLSGGQQQRVGIARAIVHRPALLVADEPTGNLDPELSARVMRMFTQFQQLGVTILVATHERAVVESLPFRRLVIERGQLISDGLGPNR